MKAKRQTEVVLNSGRIVDGFGGQVNVTLARTHPDRSAIVLYPGTVGQGQIR